MMLMLTMGEMRSGCIIDTYEEGTRQFTARPKDSKPKHLPTSIALSTFQKALSQLNPQFIAP